MTIVAIHQPNFFPWLGYFDKIRRADVFIFLDDVQYQKTGGSWSNRVQISINGEGRWLTAPADRSFHGTKNINDMFFSSREDWRSKMLKSLVTTYKRTPFFDEAYSLIEPLVQNPENNIAEYNIHAIKTLSHALGLSTKSMAKSSELTTESCATERLIDLTLKTGGNIYLCGGGAGNYQDDDAFQKAGVKLLYQSFLHPEYPQSWRQDFIAGLSIIDALMNIGLEGAMKLLKK